MALINNLASTFSATTGYVSHSAALSPAQAAILASELSTDPTARGYAGKTAQQQADLVNGVYSIPNPTPQATLTLTVLNSAQMAALGSAAVAAVEALAADNPARTPLLETLQSQEPFMGVGLNTYVLSAPALSDLINAVQQSGAMTADQVATYTTQLDPAWQADLPQPPRSSVLFVDRNATPVPITSITIEESDIAALGGQS